MQVTILMKILISRVVSKEVIPMSNFTNLHPKALFIRQEYYHINIMKIATTTKKNQTFHM
jgi:hypothetical protein